jgi:hypothetical protein
MSDIKELLDEAVGSYEPRSDQRAVEERVERRKQRRRFAAGSVAVAVFVLAGWFAWTAFRPGGATVGSTGSGTYVLSDFEVSAHIERDSIAPGPAEVDRSQADVSFTMQWSSNEYPGEHRCSLHVFDAAGSAIGSFSSPIASLLEDNSSSTPVPVTGLIEGATATGSCGPERLDTPIGYEISDVHLTDDLTVSYVAGWPDSLIEGEYPGTNACTVTLFESGHPIAEKHLTLAVGDQQEVTSTQFNKFNDSVLVPRASLDATVVCSPYVGEGVYPDPKPLTDASVPPESGTVLVPDVTGLSQEEAGGQLESLGLTIRVTLTAAEGTPEGLVASQDPAPGTSVNAGATVTIVISEGSAGEWPEVSYGGDFTPYVDHVIDIEGVLDPDVVGKKHVVAYGTVQGIPWSLTGFMSTDHSDDPIPVGELFLGRGGRFGGSGLRFSGPQFGVSGTGFGSVGLTAYAGIVGESVAAVEFRPASDEARPIRLFEGPSTLGSRYFVLWPPTGAVGEIVALDASGEVVDQASLCVSADIPEDSTVGC